MSRADALPAAPEPAALAAILLELEAISERLEQLSTFAGCSAAADATGREAVRADSRSNDLWTLYSRASVVPVSRIVRAPDAAFEALLATPALEGMRGYLLDVRRGARLRLPEAEEALANELSRDGITAWGELYDQEAGALRVRVDRGNGEEELSAGQVSQLLYDQDAAVRERSLAALQAGWRSLGTRCAKALSHITGTRIVLNRRRGLDPLDEPLQRSRIERGTLDAMMEAARQARPLLERYLAAKARALGKPSLSWSDVNAPLGGGGARVSYDEAQSLIVDQFSAFSPTLADFSRRAFRERWIEVEDRPNKRGGGFCADAPLTRQSRIFMTWGHNSRSVSTLAHELGHAFHNEVLYERRPAQRRVPMTLAETASTFGEALVREATLAATTDPRARLGLLDTSLADALAFLANVPARFELEQALYRMRASGPLEVEALEAETAAIFSRWFGAGVTSVDPTFWSSKLHFFIASVSFYNFPYTFGYLFSSMVYAHFRPLGAAGAPGYERLLRRTGDEWAEPIARDELGVDLADPAAWSLALDPVRRDLDAFCALVEGN